MAKSRYTLMPSKNVTIWWVVGLVLCLLGLLAEQTILLGIGALLLIAAGVVATRQRIQTFRTALNGGVHPLDEREEREA